MKMSGCRTVLLRLFLLGILSGGTLYADLSGILKEGSGKWGYSARFHTATLPWDGSAFTAVLRLKLPLNAKGEALLARESWTGIYVQDSRHHHRYIPALVSRDFSSATGRIFPLLIAYEKKGHIQWRGEHAPLSPGNGEFELEVSFAKGNLRFRARPEGGVWIEAGNWKTPDDFTPDTIGISLDAYHKKGVPGEIRYRSFHVAGKQKSFSFDFSEEDGCSSALK